MISKKTILIVAPIIILMVGYWLGPQPSTPTYNFDLPGVPQNPTELEQYITNQESRHKLKPDNEARIVWADSSRSKTGYAIVYLPGFSASQMEGDPIHRKFAKDFGCNLYLARLADHGIDTVETLLNFTAERFWNSAKEALAIGGQLGERVILVSTSTGGTAALMLAANFPEQVHALINLSPNVALRDPAAFLLNDPWGLQIARMVMGGNYREWIADPERVKYWNNKYRLESLVQLEELLETTMTKETFTKIHQPVLTLYYYKNEEEQDPEVSVAAMLKMHQQLSTPDSLQSAIAIPGAGAHVLGSSLVSKDVEGVYREMEKFAEEKLKMVQKR
jgi:pimeloyl-ACP methyl ester carboxylesterase